METLKQAIFLAQSGERSVAHLHGKPPGGWGETVQATTQLIDDLPSRSRRDYSATQLIDALYDVVSGRYDYRPTRAEREAKHKAELEKQQRRDAIRHAEAQEMAESYQNARLPETAAERAYRLTYVEAFIAGMPDSECVKRALATSRTS